MLCISLYSVALANDSIWIFFLTVLLAVSHRRQCSRVFSAYSVLCYRCRCRFLLPIFLGLSRLLYTFLYALRWLCLNFKTELYALHTYVTYIVWPRIMLSAPIRCIGIFGIVYTRLHVFDARVWCAYIYYVLRVIILKPILMASHMVILTELVKIKLSRYLFDCGSVGAWIALYPRQTMTDDGTIHWGCRRENSKKCCKSSA